MDTGAWLALSSSDDKYHAAAGRALQEMLRASVRLVTTNHVIGESYTILTRARGTRTALAVIDKIALSTALDLVFAGEALEAKAWEWLRRFDDQRFSFVDAANFAVMSDLGLARAFGFDRHFTAAGFEMLPGVAPI